MSVPAARTPGRVMARTVLFGAGALLAAGLLTWTPAVVSGWNQGAAEGTLWQLLNGARVNNGMAPLQQHGTLVGLARWRSGDMLARDYFSHTIPGCGCAVYAYYDQNGVNYVWGGENIAWNSGRSDADSPVAAHNAFMNSAGHRANVLNVAFTHGAVGAAAVDNQMFQGYVQNTRMYTELFMQAPGAAPAPAPAPVAPAPAPAAPAAPPAQAAAPAAAAPAAPAPAEPTAAEVTVAAPVRPTSDAVDGTAELVSSRAGEGEAAPADEPVAAPAADAAARPSKTAAEAGHKGSPTAEAEDGAFAVSAPEAEDAGLVTDLFQALLGFLFG